MDDEPVLEFERMADEVLWMMGSGYEKRHVLSMWDDAATVTLRPQPPALCCGCDTKPGAAAVSEESEVQYRELAADLPINTCNEEVSNRLETRVTLRACDPAET